MKVSILAFAKDTRSGFKPFFVVLVLSAAAAALSDYAFSPWQFDPLNAQEASRSTIPRVAIWP